VSSLAKRFVPVTDEVWRLQRGTDPECRFFQSFADRGHYRGGGGTRQGIYVVTPGGSSHMIPDVLRAVELRTPLDLSPPPCIADLDQNGILDLGDVGLFVQTFVNGCP